MAALAEASSAFRFAIQGAHGQRRRVRHASCAGLPTPLNVPMSSLRLRVSDRGSSSALLRPVRIGLLACALALIAACGKSGQGQAGAGGPGGPGGAPPPPQVGVVEVTPGNVALSAELPGRLEALRVAQVRARVPGIVQRRVFEEGSDVKAGQLLFEIDARPLRAALQSAQAAMARAQANEAQAQALAKRYAPLVKANAVSRQEYDVAQAAAKSSQAEVAAARAAVETARINLDYASVTAPIDGRIGRALVTEGALVGQGEPTPLALIQQIRPLYVNFTQSATEVLNLRRALASGQVRRAEGAEAAEVHVVLEDGSVYPHAGRLLFSDLSVDPASGQVTLRAEVPNPDGLLLPGMYVRVRISQAEYPNAILLPQQAVTRTAQGDTVLVVGAENKPEPRKISIGPAQGNNWVVLSGLKPGERVIVDGFQKMMVPGAPVTPVPWKPAGAGSAPGGAAPAPAAPAARDGGSPAGSSDTKAAPAAASR